MRSPTVLGRVGVFELELVTRGVPVDAPADRVVVRPGEGDLALSEIEARSLAALLLVAADKLRERALLPPYTRPQMCGGAEAAMSVRTEQEEFLLLTGWTARMVATDSEKVEELWTPPRAFLEGWVRLGYVKPDFAYAREAAAHIQLQIDRQRARFRPWDAAFSEAISQRLMVKSE